MKKIIAFIELSFRFLCAVIFALIVVVSVIIEHILSNYKLIKKK
jgi:hypothetical protein